MRDDEYNTSMRKSLDDMIMAVVDDDEFMMTEVDHDYNNDGAEMMKPMTIMPTTMLLVLTSLLLPEASSTR